MVVASNGRHWAGDKKSDSDEDEKEGEALAAAANDKADGVMTWARGRSRDQLDR